MEEKLINAIQMHPCIYDKSSLLFRNKYMKDRAWQEVASSTGVSEEHCKARWKSLRDRFVREVSGSKLKSGAAAQEKTDWCYMESMRFLTKHISPRNTTSNFQWSDDQSCSQTSNNSGNEDATEDFGLSSSGSNKTPKRQASNNSGNEDATEDFELSSSGSNKAPKRQRLGNESRERFERLCGTIESVIAAKVEKPTSRNSAFLQMLDECLQKKPQEIQDRLKIELLTYVHNAN